MSFIYDFLHFLRKLYWRTFHVKTFGVRVIMERDDQFFLVHHRYGNLWVFPGGGVKKNENLEYAARREVLEETNIFIKSFKRKLGEYKNTAEGKDDTVTIFVAQDWEDGGRKWNFEIKESGFFHHTALPEATSQATLRRIKEYLSGDACEFSGIW